MSFLSRWFGGGAAAEPEKPKEPVNAPNQVYFCREKLNPNFLLPGWLLSDEAAGKVRPPASVLTLADKLKTLKANEKEAYDKFCALIGGAEAVDKLEQGGFTVLRYLIARNYDVDKSVVLLKSTFEWRKTLPSICKWCKENPASHCAEFVGWDKQSRPVIWMSYRYALERGDATASEHHMCSAFDHSIRMMPEGVTQWVTMVDFAGFSILRDSSPSVARHIVKILSDHYPERLGCFILVNAIAGTFALFKLLGPLLDERTKAKVKFAYSKGSPAIVDVFEELFPPHLAKWLVARYNENYENLALGALEGASTKDMEQHAAAAAAAAAANEPHVTSLDEAAAKATTELPDDGSSPSAASSASAASAAAAAPKS